MELYKHSQKVQQFLDDYIADNINPWQLTDQKEIYEIMKDFRNFLRGVGDFEDTTTQLVIKEYEKIYKVLLPDVKELSAEVLERTYQGMLNQIPAKLNQQIADYTRLVSSAVDTGGMTRQQAVREVNNYVKKLQASGKLKYTHALDSAGRKWRIDYLVKRDIRDAQKRSANRSAERINQELGGEGVYKISTVPNCRDSHLLFQGAYFADVPGKYRVARRGVINALAWSIADVGAVDGLFGINCRHVKIPVFATRHFDVPLKWNPLEKANEAIIKLES